MKYLPWPKWKLWNTSGLKRKGLHSGLAGKSWNGPRECHGTCAAADCIEGSHCGCGEKSSYAMPPMPPQQRWHTPAPWPAKLSEPPCLGALLKWRSKCPAAIKNGQSPLMPVQASRNSMVEPWACIWTPSLSAISKSETMNCMHSSNASLFSA